MKKRLRIIAVLLMVALLAAAWTWRYVTMNRYYDDLDNGDYKLYQMGDTVPYEDDGTDIYTDLNGYYIRADRFEIRDYDDYLKEAGITIDTDYPPQKLALVSVTLGNESCEEGGISLTELYLRGVDSVAVLDWDVVVAANPILQGNLGIAVEPGQTCKLILPFGLYEHSYSRRTWRYLDDYKLYLQVTNALTTKEIQVNG